MVSSKLSKLTANAKKPPLCLSKPPPPSWYNNLCSIRINWYWATYPPLPIDIDQTEIVTQDLIDSTLFFWDNPSPGPNLLTRLELSAPHDPTYNSLVIQARDQYNTNHYSETYFQPSRPPPFNQGFTCFSYDYPIPGTILAQITPVLL